MNVRNSVRRKLVRNSNSQSVNRLLDSLQRLFKELYKQANSQMPAEFKAFAAALLSSTYDEENTTATAGLAIITIDSALISEQFGGNENAFIE